MKELMQLPLSEVIEIPVEQIRTHINVDEMDFYSSPMAVKLAKKHYERQGYQTLTGVDFENNMLLALNTDIDRRYLDDYSRVKLGRAKVTDEINVYSDQLLPALSKEVTDILLYLCRICSYAGDPGFPDIILLKDNDWQLKYVIFDELQLSQRLFLLLAKLLGIDIGLTRVVFGEKPETIGIVPSSILGTVLNDSRALSIIHGIEEGLELEKERLHEARGTDELASVEDEITYLLTEKKSKPFNMLQKWLASGLADSDDLIENMSFIITNNEEEKDRFVKYEKQLQADPVFSPIASKKTEDVMRQKAAYFQKKFGLGPSHAKALLRFIY